MNKKEFNEVLKEAFEDVKVDDIEKDLNENNIFVAEDLEMSEEIKEKIRENRSRREELSSAKREILKAINSLTEDKAELMKKITKAKILIKDLEADSKRMFTIYEGIVGADFGTMAMALMLEYNPTQYNKLKVGERYLVTRLKKGANKDAALKTVNEINNIKQRIDKLEDKIFNINYRISELDEERGRISIKLNSLDIDYKILSSSNRVRYIGVSNLDTDIYIDPVDFSHTLKECFGTNGTGILKGIKIC